MKAAVEQQAALMELQRIDSAIMAANHRLNTLPEHEQIKQSRLALLPARQNWRLLKQSSPMWRLIYDAAKWTSNKSRIA